MSSGLRKQPYIYRAYLSARERCKQKRRHPADRSIKPSTRIHSVDRSYRLRGIQFRFTSFEQWTMELGPRPSPRHTVDRINNDGHYEPGNVHWAMPEEQADNRRGSAAEIARRRLVVEQIRSGQFTMTEIGRMFGISRVRVTQLRARAQRRGELS